MNRINHRGTTREDGGANESQQNFKVNAKPLKVAKSDYRGIYSKLTTPKNSLGSWANVLSRFDLSRTTSPEEEIFYDWTKTG